MRINWIFSSCLSAKHICDTCPADEPSVGALESLSQTQIVPGGSDIAPCSPLCPTAVGRGAWRTPKLLTSSLRKTQKSSSRIFVKSDMAALALFILWVFFLLKKNNKKSTPSFYYEMKIIICFTHQARNGRTNEVVAIKKMSYSGKQSNEVMMDLTNPNNISCWLFSRVFCYCYSVCSRQTFTVFTEMARHHQRSEIPAENTTPKLHRIQRMLSTGAHRLGKKLHTAVAVISTVNKG